MFEQEFEKLEKAKHKIVKVIKGNLDTQIVITKKDSFVFVIWISKALIADIIEIKVKAVFIQDQIEEIAQLVSQIEA